MMAISVVPHDVDNHISRGLVDGQVDSNRCRHGLSISSPLVHRLGAAESSTALFHTCNGWKEPAIKIVRAKEAAVKG